jgi:hypothetical protein
MKSTLRVFSCLLLAAAATLPVHAFCGFYVAKADTTLFNQASKVVMARDGDRTVMTMANDFQGDPTEFAIVVPVPTFLEKGQIHVGERAAIDHLDAYTAPRLVEYFDSDPCMTMDRMQIPASAAPMRVEEKGGAGARAKSLGVTIEAQYTVGEYDILILSAKESDGLETWLKENGYKLPKGASPVLGSYIKQKMRFFVAKVNLEEKSKLGYTFLRPLQVAYESPKFMLPIRLGTLNANGPQELFVFALNRTGRIETTNYRTIRLPSDQELPVLVKEKFNDFYRAMFSREVQKDGMRAVYLEYAWDMGWCDPCAADPLSSQELRQLGVFWTAGEGSPPGAFRAPPSGGQNVFVTRLHVRYDAASFPEDLVFQETGDRQNFQGRYIVRHAWNGSPNACPAARQYFENLRQRQEREAQTLANLTGWKVEDIRRGVSAVAPPPEESPKKQPTWWEQLWSGGK